MNSPVMQGLNLNTPTYVKNAKLVAWVAEMAALCKATAVRIGTALAAVEGQNRLNGPVWTSAPAGGETSLALSPQLQLIGFATLEAALTEGQMAQAVVDEAAVVIAIPD